MTYQRIQEPHATPVVEDFDGVEQDDDWYTKQYDRVIEIEAVTTDLVKVDLHGQTQKKKIPTRKLETVSMWWTVMQFLCAYFSKLSPVQVVARVIFKDENVVDFGFMPNAAR